MADYSDVVNAVLGDSVSRNVRERFGLDMGHGEAAEVARVAVESLTATGAGQRALSAAVASMSRQARRDLATALVEADDAPSGVTPTRDAIRQHDRRESWQGHVDAVKDGVDPHDYADGPGRSSAPVRRALRAINDADGPAYTAGEDFCARRGLDWRQGILLMAYGILRHEYDAAARYLQTDDD